MDEEGNRYSVDRETGEKTLIEPAQSTGEIDAPSTVDEQEED